ncbi:conserved hypothetical protein [Chloroherpeton thalassium ATCC 35110]|uniref:DUF4340 domain-containing protein n=1 Tax=Chloroherpeton thalassium (strain ATCC 35110 / GB-78) TaxID=517418 RepID=B3QTY9_CHLT3|nr:DUF4340 domain-containing protein [Chloroherpeton thalassium]ACF12787.1 conserved hypothetical protein [Chloroherpeton thalassium ATCC 35110]
MMNEQKKTLIFVATALMLGLLGFLSAPKASTPDAFADVGAAFFPDFTDPNTAAVLEVVKYDEETASARPFKVTFKKGLWVIPSEYNYPADGKEQLSKTAAAMIQIKKEDFRTDNPAEFESLGVIDPLDESSTAMSGHGKRVTVRNENDKVLADLIIGKKVSGKKDYYFVREPEGKRVYTAKLNFEISTKFNDWIDTDLLQLDKKRVSEILLKDYSINEVTGTVDERGEIRLSKNGETWMLDRMKPGEDLNTKKVAEVLSALDELKIVGVRPKPSGLSAGLKKQSAGIEVSKDDMLSLQSKGYFFTRDGRLLSNEGELQLRTEDGVIYTLRFGEVVPGENDEDDSQTKENRFLFLTASFDEDAFKEPKQPESTAFETKPDSLWSAADRENKKQSRAHEKWQKQVEDGKKLASSLTNRFADWYYIIPGKNFDKLKLSRRELLKEKNS